MPRLYTGSHPSWPAGSAGLPRRPTGHTAGGYRLLPHWQANLKVVSMCHDKSPELESGRLAEVPDAAAAA